MGFPWKMAPWASHRVPFPPRVCTKRMDLVTSQRIYGYYQIFTKVLCSGRFVFHKMSSEISGLLSFIWMATDFFKFAYSLKVQNVKRHHYAIEEERCEPWRPGLARRDDSPRCLLYWCCRQKPNVKNEQKYRQTISTCKTTHKDVSQFLTVLLIRFNVSRVGLDSSPVLVRDILNM